VPAADLQERFPRECLARVRVHLRDGRTFAGPTMGARGDYTDPASDAELDAKFQRLAGRTLGTDACRRLGEIIDTIEGRPAADLLDALGSRSGRDSAT
jgi:hypothetical protein